MNSNSPEAKKLAPANKIFLAPKKVFTHLPTGCELLVSRSDPESNSSKIWSSDAQKC